MKKKLRLYPPPCRGTSNYLFSITIAISLFFPCDSFGQTIADYGAFPLPSVSLSDSNGVDLWTGSVTRSMASIAIGDGSDAPSLQFKTIWSGSGPSHNFLCYAIKWTNPGAGGNASGKFLGWKVICKNKTTQFRVTTQGTFTDKFTFSEKNPNGDGSLISVTVNGGGETLVAIPRSGSTDLQSLEYPPTFVYTDRDGVQTIFQAMDGNSTPYASFYWDYSGNYSDTPLYLSQSSTKPNGEILNYYYNNYTRYFSNGNGAVVNVYEYLLQSVTSNYGFSVNFNYPDPYPPSTGWSGYSPFYFNYTATIYNSSIDYCNPTATHCEFGKVWPYQKYAVNKSNLPSGIWTQFIQTNSDESKYYYNLSPATYTNPTWSTLPLLISSINSPGGMNNVNFTYGWYNSPTLITSNGVSTQYSWKNIPNFTVYTSIASQMTSQEVTVSKGNSENKTYDTMGAIPSSGVSFSALVQQADAIGNTTLYGYLPGCSGQDSSVIYPEGQQVQVIFDERCNITEAKYSPKPGSSLSAFSISQGFDTSCSNPVTCNKPNWIRDSYGNQTDYQYDPTHGGVLTLTSPPDANGVRPQKRYSYVQLSAKALTGSASLSPQTPIWRLSKISECINSSISDPASCVGSTSEKVTTYSYDNNNLLVSSKTISLGDGTDSITNSYDYDAVGNKISETDPRGNISYFTYDVLRRKVFEISAAPDANGRLPRNITHHVYDADGHEIRLESGTGFAVDGTDFIVLKFKRMTYDNSTGQLIKIEEVQP